jgi:hypothetical protein
MADQSHHERWLASSLAANAAVLCLKIATTSRTKTKISCKAKLGKAASGSTYIA